MVPFRKGADGVVARESRFAMRFETFACERPPSLDGCALSGLRGLRPPSAALRWLRDFLLMPHPPLLTEEGNGSTLVMLGVERFVFFVLLLITHLFSSLAC